MNEESPRQESSPANNDQNPHGTGSSSSASSSSSIKNHLSTTSDQASSSSGSPLSSLSSSTGAEPRGKAAHPSYLDRNMTKQHNKKLAPSSAGSMVSHSSSQSSGSSGARTYRNSPFGLKNHFLTMPPEPEEEPGAGQEQSHYITSSETESGGAGWRGYMRQHSKHHGHHSHSHAHQNKQAKSTNDHRHHTKSINSLQHPAKLNSTGAARIQSDAGLDADACNAKQQEQQQIHYPSSNHHLLDQLSRTTQSNEPTPKLMLPNHQHTKQQLVLASGSRSPNEAEQSTNLLIRFSSIMYATFLVILGCIFHISELRQKSKNSSDHIYTIIVAFVGIMWLLYLQIDLLRYKRFASRYILIESIFNDHQSAKRRRLVEDGARSPTGSSAASLVNDRLSLNTEVLFKKTAYKMYRHQAALSKESRLRRLQAGARLPTMMKTGHHDVGGSEFGGSSSICQEPARGIININSIEHDNNGDGLDELNNNSTVSLEPAYKFLHGKMGANFYLKCGMAAFCFGHVIHEGLRFGQQLYFFGDGNVHCRDSAALFAHLITPLYSFYQLFMMFKYSNVSTHTKRSQI